MLLGFDALVTISCTNQLKGTATGPLYLVLLGLKVLLPRIHRANRVTGMKF